MIDQQITNIAIKIGEVQQKADFALWGAMIAAAGAIIAAAIAGYFKWQLNQAQKQHEKQWAFIGKKTALFDAAIETLVRMLWNKLLITNNLYVELAGNNLFLLQKDSLAIESQLYLYGNQKLADAVALFKEKIISTDLKAQGNQWAEILDEGRKQLDVLKSDLGTSVTEGYNAFKSKLGKPVVDKITEDVLKQIGGKPS